jgi:hypothetical protein
MSKNESSYPDPGRIKFGRGGLIRDVPENQVLLRQIADAPALSPSALFKLVTFFLGYPTNKPLAKHIALFAAISELITRTKPEDRRPKLKRTSSTSEEEKSEQGGQPDWWDGWDEPGKDELGENPFEARLVKIKWVSHLDIGLLVEVVKLDDSDDGQEKLAHFVVAVSPHPDTLPND